MVFSFSINQSHIINPLALIGGLSAKTIFLKDGNPALFKLNPAGSLEIYFSDVENSFWKNIELKPNFSKIDSEILFYLPSRKLHSFLHSFGGADIDFIRGAVKNSAIQIKVRGYEVNLIEQIPEHNYKVKELDLRGEILITRKELSSILKKVSFCILDQKIRKSLMGMNIQLYNNKWYFVGSDSFRISICKIESDPIIKFSEELKNNIIINKRNLEDINKVIEDLDQDQKLSLLFDSRQFAIKAHNIYYKSLLIAEDYPDISRFYKWEGSNTINIDGGDLLNALRIFKNNTEKEDSQIKLILNKTKLELNLKNDVSSIKKEIDCNYSGKEGLDISFDVNYLYDAVASLDASGEIRVSFEDNSGPVCFKNKEMPWYLHILMPTKNN